MALLRLALVLLALPAGAQMPPRGLAGVPEKDRQAFLRIQEAFESAAAKSDFKLLEPYLDPKFQGRMVSDEDVRGVDGLREFWRKIGKTAVDQKVGRYTVKLKPEDVSFSGDAAVARGRTEERFQVRPGEFVDFRSDWEARLSRGPDGRWRLAGMNARLDPADKAALVLKSVAKAVLYSARAALKDIPRIPLPRLRLQKGDFDGDGVELRGRYVDNTGGGPKT